MIILIVLVGLISPFFTEGMIEKLKTAKGNNLEVFWDITHKVIYTKDKSKCSLIPTKRLRYECTQWIDINNIIFNQSKCSALEDKYFEENCLNRNITFYKLKDSIKNNNIPKEEENLRGKESLCYDRDLLALYCDKLIPSISDIFSKDNLIKNKKCNEFNKNLEKNCLNVIEMSKEFERRYNRPLNCLQLRNYCYYIDLFDLKKHLV